MAFDLKTETGRTAFVSADGHYLEKKTLTMKPECWRLLYSLAREEGMTLAYYIVSLGKKAQAEKLLHYQDRIDDLQSVSLSVCRSQH